MPDVAYIAVPVWALVLIIGGVGTAVWTVSWWSVRSIVRRIGMLESTLNQKLSNFNTRMTRIETVLRMSPQFKDALPHEPVMEMPPDNS